MTVAFGLIYFSNIPSFYFGMRNSSGTFNIKACYQQEKKEKKKPLRIKE